MEEKVVKIINELAEYLNVSQMKKFLPASVGARDVAGTDLSRVSNFRRREIP